jgi:hypothetical protein
MRVGGQREIAHLDAAGDLMTISAFAEAGRMMLRDRN